MKQMKRSTNPIARNNNYLYTFNLIKCSQDFHLPTYSLALRKAPIINYLKRNGSVCSYEQHQQASVYELKISKTRRYAEQPSFYWLQRAYLNLFDNENDSFIHSNKSACFDGGLSTENEVQIMYFSYFAKTSCLCALQHQYRHKYKNCIE